MISRPSLAEMASTVMTSNPPNRFDTSSNHLRCFSVTGTCSSMADPMFAFQFPLIDFLLFDPMGEYCGNIVKKRGNDKYYYGFSEVDIAFKKKKKKRNVRGRMSQETKLVFDTKDMKSVDSYFDVVLTVIKCCVNFRIQIMYNETGGKEWTGVRGVENKSEVLHEGFVIGSDLLNMDVTFGFNVRFNGTECIGTGYDGDNILKIGRIFYLDLSLTRMCMSNLNYARKLGWICNLINRGLN